MSSKNVCFALCSLIANVGHEPSVLGEHPGIVRDTLHSSGGIVERQPHPGVGVVVDSLSVKVGRVRHDGPEAPGDEMTMTIAVVNIGACSGVVITAKVVSQFMTKGVISYAIYVYGMVSDHCLPRAQSFLEMDSVSLTPMLLT